MPDSNNHVLIVYIDTISAGESSPVLKLITTTNAIFDPSWQIFFQLTFWGNWDEGILASLPFRSQINPFAAAISAMGNSNEDISSFQAPDQAGDVAFILFSSGLKIPSARY
jgi:hypothetical protein